MEMAGATFAKRPVIDVGAEARLELGLAQDLGVGIAERIPLVFPLAQAVELRGLWDRMQIAPLEVAIDFVFRDTFDDELLGLFGNGEAFERIFLAELVFDALLSGGEAGADLSSIAPWRDITDLAGFENDDLVARFGKLQCYGKPGKAGANDANIGVVLS